MSTGDDELYQCVGVCMVDEASGLCMGCGRPVCEPALKAAPEQSKAGPSRDLIDKSVTSEHRDS